MSSRQPHVDVTIFKMHGDANHPAHAVITKDDYEFYLAERPAFTAQLAADLLCKRFLFLGLSFTDRNIEYTLNRLGFLLNRNNRDFPGLKDHYCLLRTPQPDDYDSRADLTQDEKQRHLKLDLARFAHKIEELKRFGLQTVVVKVLMRLRRY